MREFDRHDSDEPPLPKPYAFVPIPETRTYPEHPAGHDAYTGNLLTGTITGTLHALSPIHVASGNIELTGRQPPLVKAHFRRNDRPTIPGSSLKGAIRSIVEAISNPPSCVHITKALPANLPRNAKRCAKKDSLCIACRMFGAMDYLGQVHFSDAFLQTGNTEILLIPSLSAPHPREQLYFEEGLVKGRKFYMHGQDGKTAPGNVPVETCPVGSHFLLRVDFENLSRGQLTLLLVAMGQGIPRLVPKLGGGKPACCGSIELRDVRVATVNHQSSAKEFDFETAEENLSELVATTGSVDTNNLTRLAEILTYPGERACPDRNY
jgi:hypothetical protein